MLSGRSLCDELITRQEEIFRLCCVVVCDLETSRMGAPYIYIYIYIYDISSLRVKELLMSLCAGMMQNLRKYDVYRRLSNVLKFSFTS